MKIVAIAVFFSLVIIPLFISAFYRIYRAFGNKAENETKENTPAITPEQAKSRRKRNYSILSVYLVLFLASGIWMAYELFNDDTNLLLTLSIIFGLYFVLFLGGLFGWAIFRNKKLLNKYPMPNVAYDSKEYWEWHNKYTDETSKGFGYGSIRNFIIVICSSVLLYILLVVIVIIFVH
jgi:hypothetical protein